VLLSVARFAEKHNVRTEKSDRENQNEDKILIRNLLFEPRI